MALILCPECKKEISDRASVCIHCGFPIAEYLTQKGQMPENTFSTVEENAGPDTCTQLFDKLYYESKRYLLSGNNKKRFLKYFPVEIEDGEDTYQPVHWEVSDALETMCREFDEHLAPLAPNAKAYSAYVDNLIVQLYERNRWYSFDNNLFENMIWDYVDFRYANEETMDHMLKIVSRSIDDGDPSFAFLTIMIDKLYDNGTRRQEQGLRKMMKKFQFAFQMRTYQRSWQMMLGSVKRSCSEWKESH